MSDNQIKQDDILLSAENLSISFGGVTGDPQVTISRVNNQTIGYIMPNGTAQDVTAPQFNTPVADGYQKIGSEYTLAPFYAADVLDPNITVSMSGFPGWGLPLAGGCFRWCGLSG